MRIDDILYLESDNVYIHVHTMNNNKLLVRSTLQNYIDIMGTKHFFRVHRSYVVNTNYIDTINSESVFIKAKEIPIGRAFRDELPGFLRLG